MEKTVCHISYNHDAFDDRIYWKELLTLQNAGYKTIHLCVGDENKDFISKEGVRIILVKRRKSEANIWLQRFMHVIFKNSGTIDDIMRKAEEVTADVYHYHDLQVNALVKKLKQLSQKPKVIYDVHEIYWLLAQNDKPVNLMQKYFLKIYSIGIKKWELIYAQNCDYLILTDYFGLNHFKKHCQQVSQSIVYNYSFFEPVSDIKPFKKYDFIYTGLISKTRGVEAIIQACAVLRQVHLSFQCIIIGDADSEEYVTYLNQLITSSGLNDYVEIHPAVPFEHINQYYEQSKIGFGLYYPTTKYKNAVAIKLFEYMAYGLPVIFANHGPSSAIIQAIQCGILVDVGQVQEIAAAMKNLLTNETLYQKMSRNGKKAVRNKYNWNSEKQKLLQIYNQLLA